MAETESTNLTRLYRISTSLVSARTLHDVFQNAVLGISKSLQAKAAILWLFSGKEAVLVPTQSYMEEKFALRTSPWAPIIWAKCTGAANPCYSPRQLLRSRSSTHS